MAEGNHSKEMRELKDYISVSTKLPTTDLISFKNHCIKLNLTISERIRDLIMQDISKPSKQFLSGINEIQYNKLNNNFSWIVHLDSGKKVNVLNNLSLDFLRNLQIQIQESIKERNSWVHNINPDAVDIPKELIGEEDG
ncbi:MAG: hypothetical protein M1416_02815 [Candidatus Pacearchaeota archaeon]|nr:hypothetical protein [Candidatus Pacearchaeota archaeon]